MMKERILAINPQAKVTTIEKLYTPESNFLIGMTIIPTLSML